MTFNQIKNAGGILLGDNFSTFFGDVVVVTDTPSVFSTVLSQNRTNDEILATVTPLTLSDIYSAYSSVVKPALCYVLNDAGFAQAVFVFREAGKTRVVSPTAQQVTTWYKGVTVYSHDPITQTL